MLNDNWEMQTTKPQWLHQLQLERAVFSFVLFIRFGLFWYFFPLDSCLFVFSTFHSFMHVAFRFSNSCTALHNHTHSSVASVYMHRNWIQLSHPFGLSHIMGLLIIFLSLFLHRFLISNWLAYTITVCLYRNKNLWIR